MSGNSATEPLEDSDLRLVVGLRDGRQVGLPHDADVGPEVAERDRAGGADRVQGGLEDAVGHERGSPRTRSPMMPRWISDVPPAMAKRRAKTVWNAQRPPSGAPGAPRQSWPRRAEEAPRRLRHPDVRLAEGELQHRALGAGRLAAQPARDRAEARQPERLGLDPALGERLPRHRVLRRRPVAGGRPPREARAGTG